MVKIQSALYRNIQLDINSGIRLTTLYEHKGTTAAERTVFMYSKLIEIAVNAVLRPTEYFCWGLSYEVPLHYGLLDKATLLDQRYSNTVSEDSFARESLSIWSGNSKEAWLDSKRINKRRTLLKCERKAQENPSNPGTFYLIGVDVARYSANTAVMVIKVAPNLTGFKKNVIYTEVIHGANYITEQAPRLKKLIQLYEPREIVIDGNGRSNTWPTWEVIPLIKLF